MNLRRGRFAMYAAATSDALLAKMREQMTEFRLLREVETKQGGVLFFEACSPHFHEMTALDEEVPWYEPKLDQYENVIGAERAYCSDVHVSKVMHAVQESLRGGVYYATSCRTYEVSETLRECERRGLVSRFRYNGVDVVDLTRDGWEY